MDKRLIAVEHERNWLKYTFHAQHIILTSCINKLSVNVFFVHSNWD